MIGKLRNKFNKKFRDKSFEEVLRGSAMVFSSRIMETVFTMGTSILIARIYGAEVVGVLAVVRSLMEIMIIFCLMGTDVSVLRLIPQQIASHSVRSGYSVYLKVFKLVFFAAIILSVAVYLAAPVLAERVFHKPYLLPFIAWSAWFILPKTLFKLNLEALRGLKNFKAVATQNISLAVTNLTLLLAFTAIFLNRYIPVYSYWATMVVVGLISSYLVFKNFRKRLEPGSEVSHMKYSEIFKISGPMFLTKSAFLLIGNTDIIMLTMMRSPAEVGIYQIVWKLVMFNKFFKNSITSTAAPKLSELFHKNDFKTLKSVAKKTTMLLNFTVTPFMIFMVLFGKPIIGGLYGREFLAGYTTLIFLGSTQILTSVIGHVGMFMNMCGKQTQFLYMVVGSALMNVILNAILIPHYGMAGAAFANMVSVLFNHIAGTLYIKQHFGFTIMYNPLSFLIRKLKRN